MQCWCRWGLVYVESTYVALHLHWLPSSNQLQFVICFLKKIWQLLARLDSNFEIKMNHVQFVYIIA